MTATSAIDKSTQILSGQEPELPVEKKLRHNSYVEPVPSDQTTGPSLSNGYRSRVDRDTLVNDQPEPQTVETQVSTPAEPVSPRVETPEPEPSAPIVDIGGVSVIQEAATRVPDEKEEAMGIRLVPVLQENTEGQDGDVDMNDMASPEPTDPTIKPISPSTTESEPEIPDSQGTPGSTSPPTIPHLELEEDRLPAHISQPQQFLSHAPLVVVTTQKNRPSSIPFALPSEDAGLHPEVSSPASSIDDAETPNNGALSSATSPDASHMALEHPRDEKHEKGEIISDFGMDLADEVSEGQVQEIEEDVAEEQPSDLPSVSIVLVEAEMGVVIPPQVAEERDVTQKVEAFTEVLAPPTVQHAESPVPQRQDETPKTPVSKLPIPSQLSSAADRILQLGQPTPNSSPDPSAQLRLEHQLANGAPVPASGVPIVNKPVPTPLKSQTSEPECVPIRHPEEVEDEVQLVGSRESEPSIRQKMPMETPAQTPIMPKEVITEVREPVETVFEMTPYSVPIYVPSPEPAVGVKEAPQITVGEPEGEEEDEDDDDESEAEEDEDEDDDEDEDEEDEQEKEDKEEDIVMGGVQHNETESISVPYQPSPAEEEDEEPEDGTTEETIEERIYEEDERMDSVTPEKAPQKSLDPVMRPIQPTEEEDVVPESIAEAEIVPTVNAAPVVGTAKNGVEAIIDVVHTKPLPVVNFNLPTPDATNAQSSAPASTAAISPLRQRTSKTLRRQREREKSRSKLRKVVISSAHHAAAAAEAEAQRLREDQENQGMIVVARRRDQQAASAAARGRSAPFPPGSKTEVITRYGIIDTPLADINADKKNVEVFDVLYTVKSSQHTAKDLISRASKTVSTSNHQVHYFESQAARILAKIQKMQDEGLSSLRQIERAREPRRRKCHWDYLLEEAKWLREDFREERRWKIAVAKQVVEWVVEWYEAGEDRRELCVDRRQWGRVPKWIREERKAASSGDVDMAGSDGFVREFHQLTPEFVVGGATPEDEESDYYSQGAGRDSLGYLQDPPPAAIFTLSPEETVFRVAPTKAAEDMLGQLPLFAPPKPPNVESRRFEVVQEEWMTPIIPVTKYCTGKLALEHEEEGPPRKKSRYEYEENYELFADDSDEDDFLSGGAYTEQRSKQDRDKTRKPVPLPPEEMNVALFSPNSKNLLQRLHNAHLFRSPSDLPPAAFFESRTPSLWTAAEDEMLKQLAREYHHNWSLVATCMALEGTWHSGSERRSPWECFERWIGLEPVNPDFMKSPYYKPVQQRLDIAARVGGMYVSANPNSAGSSSQQGPMTKRRGTVPVKVEKRRVTKFFNIFDAMRKLAKKRETSISKQQSGRGMLCVLIVVCSKEIY